MWTEALLSNLVTNGRKFGHIPGERRHRRLRRSVILQSMRARVISVCARKRWQSRTDRDGLRRRGGARCRALFRDPERRQATSRSGADPDDRHRNRDTQAKCANNGQGELGKQICLGSRSRERHGVSPSSPHEPWLSLGSPPDEQSIPPSGPQPWRLFIYAGC